MEIKNEINIDYMDYLNHSYIIGKTKKGGIKNNNHGFIFIDGKSDLKEKNLLENQIKNNILKTKNFLKKLNKKKY